MTDATTAARDRIDRALAALEDRIRVLKASGGPAPVDDDLFASSADQGRSERLAARVADLESAGRAASAALGDAAALIRELASSARTGEVQAEDPAGDPDLDDDEEDAG